MTTAKCEGHAAKLLARIDDIRRSHPEMCDLLVVPGDGGAAVPVHSLVMAATSSYFMTQLTRWHDEQEEEEGGGSGSGGDSLSSSASSSAASSSSKTDDTTPDKKKMITITIPDIDASTLNTVVHFAYTGEVPLDTARKDDALLLLSGLQRLDMTDAQATTEEWVVEQLDPASVLRVRHMAERHHMAGLKAKADEYVDRNFKKVTKTEEWEMLAAEEVGDVLARDGLRPCGEINVFHALVRWARGGGEGSEGGGGGAGGGDGGGGESKGAGDDREAQFVDLLGRCVRGPLLSSNELSVVVLMEPLVVNSNPAMRAMVRVLQERNADPSQKAQFASPEPLCRRRADAVVKIFALGGVNDGESHDSMECFDPSTNEWSAMTPMSTARKKHGVAVVDGKLYAVGGDNEDDEQLSSVECFDPTTKQWSAMTPMSTVRSNLGVAVVDGKLYAVGGYDEDEDSFSSVECFYPSTEQWSAVAAMSTARSCFGVATLDGKLYAVGGFDGTNRTLSSVECFDPSTGEWSPVAAMGTGRYFHGVAAVEGKLYVAGGLDAGSSTLSNVDCFDPSTGQWRAVADMGTPRFGHAVAVVEDKLFVAGGYDGNARLSSVECFDPSTGVWSDMAPMSLYRNLLALASMECP